MKKIILIVTFLYIICNLANSQELKFFNKLDENTTFILAGPNAFQFGDSIIFYSFVKHKDSLFYKAKLLCYYNETFSEIGNTDIIKGQGTAGGLISSFIKDNQNNSWFCLTSGGLFKLSSSGVVSSYDSLLKANQILNVNSLTFDKEQNLWINAGGRIYKFVNEKLELKVPSSADFNISPNWGGNLLNQIGNKMYYITMKNTLAYYNLVTNTYDTVSFWGVINQSKYIIKNINIFEGNLFIEYSYDDDLHLVKYNGDKFENLDYYLDLVNDGNSIKYSTNITIDKDFNFYFKLLIPVNEDKKNDSIYIIDKELYKRSIYYRNLAINGEITLSKSLKLTNGDVYFPNGNYGFLILTRPMSVETLSNWLFMNKLYPNPARNKINIDFGVEPMNLNNMKVEIYDYLGRSAVELNPELIYDSGTGRGTFTCDISNLRSGYYITVLTNGKYTRSMPLFVE